MCYELFRLPLVMFFNLGGANCPLNVISYHDLAVFIPLAHCFVETGKCTLVNPEKITGKEVNPTAWSRETFGPFKKKSSSLLTSVSPTRQHTHLHKHTDVRHGFLGSPLLKDWLWIHTVGCSVEGGTRGAAPQFIEIHQRPLWKAVEAVMGRSRAG